MSDVAIAHLIEQVTNVLGLCFSVSSPDISLHVSPILSSPFYSREKFILETVLYARNLANGAI